MTLHSKQSSFTLKLFNSSVYVIPSSGVIYPGPLNQVKKPAMEKTASETILRVFINMSDSWVKKGKQTKLRINCTVKINPT